MAYGSKVEWRRGAVRLWMLWRRFYDVADGGRAAVDGDGSHPKDQAGRVSEGGGRGYDCADVPKGTGNCAGIVELAVWKKRRRGVRKHRRSDHSGPGFDGGAARGRRLSKNLASPSADAAVGR